MGANQFITLAGFHSNHLCISLPPAIVTAAWKPELQDAEFASKANGYTATISEVGAGWLDAILAVKGGRSTTAMADPKQAQFTADEDGIAAEWAIGHRPVDWQRAWGSSAPIPTDRIAGLDGFLLCRPAPFFWARTNRSCRSAGGRCQNGRGKRHDPVIGDVDILAVVKVVPMLIRIKAIMDRLGDTASRRHRIDKAGIGPVKRLTSSAVRAPEAEQPKPRLAGDLEATCAAMDTVQATWLRMIS